MREMVVLVVTSCTTTYNQERKIQPLTTITTKTHMTTITTTTVNNGRDTETGRFLPGNSGRPKGSTNKFRDKVKQFLEDNWPKLQEDFDNMEPTARVKLMADLLPYVVSRLQSTSITDSEGSDIAHTLPDIDKLTDEELRFLSNIQTKLGIFQP